MGVDTADYREVCKRLAEMSVPLEGRLDYLGFNDEQKKQVELVRESLIPYGKCLDNPRAGEKFVSCIVGEQ